MLRDSDLRNCAVASSDAADPMSMDVQEEDSAGGSDRGSRVEVIAVPPVVLRADSPCVAQACGGAGSLSVPNVDRGAGPPCRSGTGGA